MRIRSIAVLLAALGGTWFSAKGESLSVLPGIVWDCPSSSSQYELGIGTVAGCNSPVFQSNANGYEVTATANLVDVTGDGFQMSPGTATWIFDLNHVTIDGSLAVAYAYSTEPIRMTLNRYGTDVVYADGPIEAHLYVAGIPLAPTPTPAPEPASYALMGAGLGLVAWKWRRKRPVIEAERCLDSGTPHLSL